MLYYEKLERGEKKLRISNYSVENRLISFLDTANITGNENVDTFHFDFDTEWNVFSSKYFILVVDGKAYIDMLDSNNNVILRDVAYDNDNVTFGVYGISGSSKLSSNIVWLETIPSAFGQIKEVDGLPDKTVWELYTEEMLALVAQGQITLEQCQQALNDTQSARDLAQGYMNDAKGYSEDAEGYKNDTAGLKQDVVDIVNSFNANVTQKTNEFNQNATDKTNTFNQNVTDKTTSFNNNATSKTNDFNSNVTQKTNTFNQNAQDKLDAVTQAGTRAVGNVQDAEALAITHIQTEGASYDVRLDNLEAVIGTGTDTFSTLSTYEVGDIVVYENKLYRCITAIETAGAWDSTKWEEINLRQEQDEQNKKIEQLETDKELLASNYDSKEVTIEGTGTITDAINWYSDSTVKGKTSQETTSISEGDEYDSPSPEHPQTIHNVSGDVEIESSNKNLFNKDICVLAYKKRLDENGNVVTDNSSSYTLTYIRVAPSTTYTIQGTKAVTGGNVRIYYYTEDKVWISRSGPFSTDSFNFTTPSSCKYIQLQLRDMTNADVNIVQIEEGLVATSYEPHQGESITFPLSEGQKMYEGDYLADDGTHHARKERVLDGTEDIRVVSNYDTTDYYCYRLNFADSRRSKLQTELETLKCTHLKQITWYKMYSSKTNELGCSTSVDSTFVYFKVPFSTLENFKAWLATQYANNTPMILEYELAEEEIEPYTEAQQLAWEKLKKMRTYKGTTHIMASSDDLDPNVDVKYLKNPFSSIEARLELLES